MMKQQKVRPAGHTLSRSYVLEYLRHHRLEPLGQGKWKVLNLEDPKAPIIGHKDNSFTLVQIPATRQFSKKEIKNLFSYLFSLHKEFNDSDITINLVENDSGTWNWLTGITGGNIKCFQIDQSIEHPIVFKKVKFEGWEQIDTKPIREIVETIKNEKDFAGKENEPQASQEDVKEKQTV